MDVQLHVFQRDDNQDKVNRLVQSLSMGEAQFNKILRLSYLLVIAAENLSREEGLSPSQVPYLSK